MDNNLEIVKLKVIANAIVDWCSNKTNEKKLTFNNSFVSSYNRFRFTTSITELLFKSTNDKKGFWKSGIFSCYEISNENGNISVSLLISTKDLNDFERLNLFLLSNNINFSENIVVVKTWNIFTTNNKLDDLSIILDHFFYNDLKDFEKEISKWLKNNLYKIYDINFELVEGALKNISSNKYERNKDARQKCIEYHGSKCKICGFDFGRIYGEEFNGKIEVHHIKPLNEIGEEYVVNPITDLIPVCPNCHMVLHSKKDGVYTPDDVIKMLK